MRRFEICLNGQHRGTIGVDEHHRGCTSTRSLDPERSRAGEQVRHRSFFDEVQVVQNVEHRLAHPVRRRPDVELLWQVKGASAGATANYAHFEMLRPPRPFERASSRPKHAAAPARRAPRAVSTSNDVGGGLLADDLLEFIGEHAVLPKSRVVVDDALGGSAGSHDEVAVKSEGGEAKVAPAPLARTEHGAFTPKCQVDLGQLETVRGPFERREPLDGDLRSRGAEQEADRGGASSPDPAAELVQLGDAEADRASSITITVAAGTSTPTSITVVATSTEISPARKAFITRSFSFADS